MPSESNGAAVSVKPGKYRWVVVGLLLLALIINYVDRQIFGILKPTHLQPEFNWTEGEYADMVAWFQAAYAIAYLNWGRIIDRIGAKWGYAIAFLIWTAAHIAHAGARTAAHWVMVRVALGVGESGGFPASIKAAAEWFPKKERALATGIFNAGTNIGAIVAPLLVGLIVSDLNLGWRAAFWIVGLGTLLWLPIWLVLYSRPRESKFVGAPELAFIESDPPDTVQSVPWLKVFTTRETWAFAMGKFLTDPIWWMFLFWLPDFLHKTYGMDIKQFGLPLVMIYLISDIGSIGGGWLSSALLHRGWSLNAARKTALFVSGLLVLPILFVDQAREVWQAVLIIGLATAAHQGFSCNLFTLPSDVFPRSAVATVVGIGGAMGGLGGILFSKFIGSQLDQVGNYHLIFFVVAFAYIIALGVIHLITPNYAPAKID